MRKLIPFHWILDVLYETIDTRQLQKTIPLFSNYNLYICWTQAFQVLLKNKTTLKLDGRVDPPFCRWVLPFATLSSSGTISVQSDIHVIVIVSSTDISLAVRFKISYIVMTSTFILIKRIYYLNCFFLNNWIHIHNTVWWCFPSVMIIDAHFGPIFTKKMISEFFRDHLRIRYCTTV